MYLRLPAPPRTPECERADRAGVPEFQDAELSPVVFRKARPQVKADGTAMGADGLGDRRLGSVAGHVGVDGCERVVCAERPGCWWMGR